LAVLLLLSFLLLLAFLLLRAAMPLMSSLMSLGAGVTAAACVIAVTCMPADACIPAVDGVRFVPDVLAVAGLPAIAGVLGFDVIPADVFVPAVAYVLAIVDVFVGARIPADPSFHILAGNFTYNIVQWSMGHTRLSDYWTPTIGLLFFLLSEYRNIEYRSREFEKLSDFGSRSPSIGLSDIRHTKNNQLSSSAK
jgi:hypothetical protein